MKHKKIKMFISFLLALVLLVSLPLDIQANAVALEGWAIYALISYLAAMGVTFTVSGGVDALLKAVQEKTDEYIKVTGIDLLGLIHQSVTIRGGGNGGGWWFGFAAAAAVMEFIQWLRDNYFNDNSTINESQVEYIIKPEIGTITYNGNTEDIKLLINSKGKAYHYSSSSAGYISSTGYSALGTFVPYPNGFEFNNKGEDSQVSTDSALFEYVTVDGVEKVRITFSSGSSTTWAPSGFPLSDVLGVTFLTCSSSSSNWFDCLVVGFVLKDGRIYVSKGLSVLNSRYTSEASLYNAITQTATITTPEEFPDISPSEDEGVLIDTGADVSTLTTPEELAENIKQTFDDTGTITKPTVTIEKDSNVTPTPPPEPSPEIEDIEDLGLPALGEAIKNKFPFCLPSDLRDLISLLVAEPVTPKWEVDLYEWFDGELSGDTTFGIDLAEYEVLGQISRWASVISFSIFLLLITKGMIGW